MCACCSSRAKECEPAFHLFAAGGYLEERRSFMPRSGRTNMRYAAALLAYSPAVDDALFLALDRGACVVRRAERLEELWWAPPDTLDTPQAAVEACGRFVP